MSAVDNLGAPRGGRSAAAPGRSATAWLATGMVLGAVTAGCAGHSRRTELARSALDAMQPRDALRHLNKQLKVDDAGDVPPDTKGKNTLLLLDRAMVLQQLGEYELSSRDLEIADKGIELLDFSRGAIDDIGRYMFSDSAGAYKAPAYEKLLINTMNMANYLARGDLNGARVEARRLAVMQKYLTDHRDPAFALLGPGSYFAGFAFEKSGRAEEAIRYYDEALRYGTYRTLEAPLRRLAASGGGPSSPRIRGLIGQPATAPASTTAPPPPATAPVAPAEAPRVAQATAESGELLVIVSFGRVPAKEAVRIPVGLALTYCADILSPTDVARANEIAAQGLVTWVNFPRLGEPRGTWGVPRIRVGSEWASIEGLAAVDEEAYRAWDAVKGSVVASAITRMITRFATGQVVREAADDNLIGVLLSLGTQAAMTAADTPDTRSWSTLPARIAVARAELAPGTYRLTSFVRNWQQTHDVTISPGGWAVVAITALN